MKYKLKRAIFWQGQLYHEGQIVELDVEPEWEAFELIDKAENNSSSPKPILTEENQEADNESPDADKPEPILTPPPKPSKDGKK